MLYVLYTLFFISCLFLVAVVLLQPGKTDAGALFTSNISSSAFAPRGTASVLQKITIVTAIIFMLSALMISMPALTGGVSVLQSADETPAEAPAETTYEVPVVTNSNANASSVPADTNANGALIETPATNSFSNQARNSNSAAPVNR